MNLLLSFIYIKPFGCLLQRGQRRHDHQELIHGGYVGMFFSSSLRGRLGGTALPSNGGGRVRSMNAEAPTPIDTNFIEDEELYEGDDTYEDEELLEEDPDDEQTG
ncbi:unnamed protein product [Lactuca saligna]|uniref:Uncharacterized protein n=1 Tax=Lactuca saligna TaxID=75948 RepID=A0AA36E4T8_LACSI|nr:unnamed protein product [Lactuca saligna]